MGSLRYKPPPKYLTKKQIIAKRCKRRLLDRAKTWERMCRTPAIDPPWLADVCPWISPLEKLRARLSKTRAIPPPWVPRPLPVLHPKRDMRLHTTRLLQTPEWRALRERVFQRDGRICRQCNTTERLQIDHILPKAEWPFLAFDINNLQVLCQPCNFAKQRQAMKAKARKRYPPPR